jgi:hypothetical protein
LSTSSPINKLQTCFTYIVHAVGYRPHTALACLPDIYLCTCTGWMTRARAKHLWATTGISTHRQEHLARQLPLWLVVDSSRCSRLALAPPWERLPLQILQVLQICAAVQSKMQNGCCVAGPENLVASEELRERESRAKPELGLGTT